MIPTEVQIRKELQNIIEHDLFKHSPKMIAFIQYLVDKALAGDGERLKQYTIAIELLEKPSDFDPAIDPIVRIQASKLRRALESYYLIKRKDRQVKITLPKGSYNPSFESVHPEVAQSDSVTPPIPVVAVLPFSYVGNDETIKSSFLAQSFQEELNLALARFDTLSLVSPLLVNSLPMDTVSLHEANELLGARYIISGSVKAFAEQVRLTLTLSDTLNGRQIWTERFDRVISDVALFELQDELVGLVASKIASSYGALSLNEYQNIKHKALSSLNSYEARLVYLDYLVKMSPANLERTIGMFEHLNQTLPDGEARGLAILAQLYCDQYLLGQAELEGALERSKQCIAKAMDIDPQNVEVLLAQAWWALLSGDNRLVKVSTEAILELNPSSSYTLSAASWLCYLSGHFEFSVSVLQQSLIKLPISPNWLKLVFAMDTVRQGDIEPLSEFLVATQFEDNFVQLIFVALIYQWAGEERLAKKHWHMASKLHVETRQTAERLINHVIISDELSGHFNDALQALLTQ